MVSLASVVAMRRPETLSICDQYKTELATYLVDCLLPLVITIVFPSTVQTPPKFEKLIAIAPGRDDELRFHPDYPTSVQFMGAVRLR